MKAILFIITIGLIPPINLDTFNSNKNTNLFENQFVTFEDTIKSYIGLLIKENNVFRTGKTNDRLRTSDKFQIIINPLNNYYTYIISHSNENYELIINSEIIKDSTYIFPAQEDYFILDGKSIKEDIIILIFNSRQLQLEKLSLNNSYADIKSFLNEVEKSSTLIKSQKTLEIMEIAGNVRNVFSKNEMNLFLGKGSLVKEYHFDVKK